MTWRLRKGETFVLTYQSSTERHVTTTDPGYDTIRWEMHCPDEQTDLAAHRQGDSIVLRGRFKGQPVDKVLTS